MLLNFVRLGWLQLSGKTISWVEIFLGGNCPSGSYPGWEFSEWELSGGNRPGGNFPGGSFSSTSKS